MTSYVCDTVENIVWKGENAGCQHFLLFTKSFQKAYLLGLLKPWTVRHRIKTKTF